MHALKTSCQRDWDIDSEFEIERAHHSPGSHPTYDQPQRLIMISCEGEGGAVWSGCTISLFPDMTQDLAERRKVFSKARQLLHHKKVKFRLAFPATLGFTWRESGATVVQEGKKAFSNQKVASSIPCRSVLEQDTEPLLIAPDVQCAISVNVKCVYIVSRFG